ncbi:MAG: ferrous iron transporter B [Chromatiales bacterium]|nr:ferrous iron transporter B [Chromatiales bacterium]
MKKAHTEISIPISKQLFRGEKRLRIALIGKPNSGKSTLFRAVSATSIQSGALAGTDRAYEECTVQVGLDEASLVDLPSISSLHHLKREDEVALKYLMWGDDRPMVSTHEAGGPPLPLSAPDVLIQVVDATALENHLELCLELSMLARPMVIALNRMDEAQEKGLHINTRQLSEQLGVPVVPTVALMGHGLSKLFQTAVDAVRQRACPLHLPASRHICDALAPLSELLRKPQLHTAFRVPHPFLLMQVAAGDPYFIEEIEQHFPELMPHITRLRREAEKGLPRPLHEELHADRHHRSALLFEQATRIGAPHQGRGWAYWLDELFLHPHWGLVGSMVVFAAVLFVVFEVSTWLDSITAARLIELLEPWQPATTWGVVGRAVTDGLIGLIGIVIPYMIPLVMLLVALEQVGIMQRIAFVVDRGFHHIGLHGGVAVPFLLGLGCNVPAISAAAASSQGRERVVASLLITFVPCSARSAIILALAGKYLGGFGVFAIFALTVIIIAIMGKLLTRRYPDPTPGQVQEIPPYAMPDWRPLLASTWARTSDILTIVTPLLIGGSVLLALLQHYQADAIINTALTPITAWWLGLPVVLGIPILFGILRKELSLLMIFQALGSEELYGLLDWVQITTFLIFLTFYVPCISTFAVMLKLLGRRDALFSVLLSVGAALAVAGIVRVVMEFVQYLAFW